MLRDQTRKAVCRSIEGVIWATAPIPDVIDSLLGTESLEALVMCVLSVGDLGAGQIHHATYSQFSLLS